MSDASIKVAIFSEKSIPPQSPLAVSRYIHRNPIETKIPMVDRLADYPFNSFPSYDTPSLSALTFIDTHSILQYLPPPFEKTCSGYVSYCLLEVKEITGIEMYIF